MKITSISRKVLDKEIELYDIVNASPHNNFLIRANTSDIVSHNCGLLDEVDFAPGANANMQKSQIMRIYRNVKRRMESRFQRAGGDLPAMLFMVSSKKSEHDFLEKYADTVRGNPHVHIVDQPLWKVKPERYCGDTFKVAVGNKYMKSRIVSDTEDPNDIIRQGFKILDVPVEHRQAFELDIDSALMDIAGVSTSVSTKFISYDKLKACYSDSLINPFTSEVLEIGLYDNLNIQDFFLPYKVPANLYSAPVFIHLDMSLTGDKTGISAVSIPGTKTTDVYDKGNVKYNSRELYYQHLFSVAIQCPANSEISLEKNRQFIYYLKELGWNIVGVSADGYQSRDTIQQLIVKGYKASLISLDRSPDGYMTFKAALNEKRINMLYHSVLENEIINLERDNVSGKIDHPPADQGGSKDVSDSLAGALFNASKYKDDYLAYHSEDINTVLDFNTTDDPSGLLEIL